MEAMKAWRWEPFGEDIDKLVSGGDELDHDVMANHLLSDEVVIFLNMLGSSMEYQIRSKSNGRKVVAP